VTSVDIVLNQALRHVFLQLHLLVTDASEKFVYESLYNLQIDLFIHSWLVLPAVVAAFPEISVFCHLLQFQRIEKTMNISHIRQRLLAVVSPTFCLTKTQLHVINLNLF